MLWQFVNKGGFCAARCCCIEYKKVVKFPDIIRCAKVSKDAKKVLCKVWINKNETLSKIENSVTSTILIQSNWSFSNLKYLWDGYFDKVSYGLIKNYRCYTISNFWECLIFYDSDFISKISNTHLTRSIFNLVFCLHCLELDQLNYDHFFKGSKNHLKNWYWKG